MKNKKKDKHKKEEKYISENNKYSSKPKRQLTVVGTQGYDVVSTTLPENFFEGLLIREMELNNEFTMEKLLGLVNQYSIAIEFYLQVDNMKAKAYQNRMEYLLTNKDTLVQLSRHKMGKLDENDKNPKIKSSKEFNQTKTYVKLKQEDLKFEDISKQVNTVLNEGNKEDEKKTVQNLITDDIKKQDISWKEKYQNKKKKSFKIRSKIGLDGSFHSKKKLENILGLNRSLKSFPQTKEGNELKEIRKKSANITGYLYGEEKKDKEEKKEEIKEGKNEENKNKEKIDKKEEKKEIDKKEENKINEEIDKKEEEKEIDKKDKENEEKEEIQKNEVEFKNTNDISNEEKKNLIKIEEEEKKEKIENEIEENQNKEKDEQEKMENIINNLLKEQEEEEKEDENIKNESKNQINKEENIINEKDNLIDTRPSVNRTSIVDEDMTRKMEPDEEISKSIGEQIESLRKKIISLNTKKVQNENENNENEEDEDSQNDESNKNSEYSNSNTNLNKVSNKKEEESDLVGSNVNKIPAKFMSTYYQVESLMIEYMNNFNECFYQDIFEQFSSGLKELYKLKYKKYIEIRNEYHNQIKENEYLLENDENLNEEKKSEIQQTIDSLNEEQQHQIATIEDEFNRKIMDKISEFKLNSFKNNSGIQLLEERVKLDIYSLINESFY